MDVTLMKSEDALGRQAKDQASSTIEMEKLRGSVV